MKKKIIVVIASGVGDRPNVEMDGLTPLQYAKTPHLDQLAKEGMTGIMDLISPGITVGTDMGHLIFLEIHLSTTQDADQWKRRGLAWTYNKETWLSDVTSQHVETTISLSQDLECARIKWNTTTKSLVPKEPSTASKAANSYGHCSII